MSTLDRIMRLRTYVRAIFFALRHPKWTFPLLPMTPDRWPDPPENIKRHLFYKDLDEWGVRFTWEKKV
jgi:hypothetical protein